MPATVVEVVLFGEVVFLVGFGVDEVDEEDEDDEEEEEEEDEDDDEDEDNEDELTVIDGVEEDDTDFGTVDFVALPPYV